MTRRFLDRLQSLLVALSLAFLVWMYVNGRERWLRRGHDDAMNERTPPTRIENWQDTRMPDTPGTKP
jgi:hypothetical protein